MKERLDDLTIALRAAAEFPKERRTGAPLSVRKCGHRTAATGCIVPEPDP